MTEDPNVAPSPDALPPEPTPAYPQPMQVVQATAEALALLPPIPVDPPKRKPEKVTEAYRFDNEDVWHAVRSDGVPFLNRSLPGAEGWIREGSWPTAPDGLPVSVGAMIALGIPEPPGGSLADIYVAPGHSDVLHAVIAGKDLLLGFGEAFKLGWRTVYIPATSLEALAPGEVQTFPPASARIQRIRQAKSEGHEL